MPIVSDRLKALVEKSPKWTPTALAKELQQRGIAGASRPTIGNLCSGKTTCRAPVRTGLAAIFSMPEEWLADPKFFLTPSMEHLWHVLDERPQEEQERIPARCELALYEIHGKIAAAWCRDLEEGIAPKPEWDPEERGPVADPTSAFVHYAIIELFSLWRWRLTFFDIADVGREVSGSDADAFVPAFADAMEVLLRPWLEGNARLDYDRFYSMVNGLNSIGWAAEKDGTYGSH